MGDTEERYILRGDPRALKDPERELQRLRMKALFGEPVDEEQVSRLERVVQQRRPPILSDDDD